MRLRPGSVCPPLVALVLLTAAPPAPAVAHHKATPHKKPSAKRPAAHTAKSAAPADAVPEGWITFRNPENSFSVLLPVDPAVKTAAIPTASGVFVFHEYKCEMIGYACGVFYADVPAGAVPTVSPEQMLSALENGTFDDETDLHWLSDRDMRVAGNLAREVVTSGPGEQRRVLRYFSAGNRIYGLETVRAYADDADHQKAMETFLNSFTLLPAGPR